MTAKHYPHVILDSAQHNIVMRASDLYGGGGCEDTFDVLVEMAIDDGLATAEGVFPDGMWSDSEGFLDSELKGIADYIKREYHNICSVLEEKRKLPV